ncbi:MAG: hypothetical protein ACRDDZ_13455 [Marinifilaceae bacterium]
MRKLLCPKCGIPNLFIKNSQGERRNIFVLADGSIIPAKEGESIDGFDTETIYCLGCSWSGTAKQLKKFVS